LEKGVLKINLFSTHLSKPDFIIESINGCTGIKIDISCRITNSLVGKRLPFKVYRHRFYFRQCPRGP
jgi:hypothetical protein